MDINHYDQLSPAEAIAYQNQLRTQIDLSPFGDEIKTIAGADISFNKYSSKVYAGIVVFSYPDLRIIEKAGAVGHAEFPYISGLLAFREVPTLLKVWESLAQKPDVWILDGQGIAHPRRMGIASHFGVMANTATIGVAKSRLFGRFEEPALEAHTFSPLMDKGEQIGVVYRSKKNCKPIFISPGHRINLEQSLGIVQKCIGKYRIPEPTRQAHHWVNELRIKDAGSSAQIILF